MKNTLLINTDGTPELLSCVDDGTNRLFINETEIDSSDWVGTGNYTFTVNNQTYTITKAADTDGNYQLIKNNNYHYHFEKIPESGGGSGGVTSYLDLTDKPSIEGVTLIGDKTHEDLNLQRISNSEIENLLT